MLDSKKDQYIQEPSTPEAVPTLVFKDSVPEKFLIFGTYAATELSIASFSCVDQLCISIFSCLGAKYGDIVAVI